MVDIAEMPVCVVPNSHTSAEFVAPDQALREQGRTVPEHLVGRNDEPGCVTFVELSPRQAIAVGYRHEQVGGGRVSPSTSVHVVTVAHTGPNGSMRRFGPACTVHPL